jgi:enoyl-CoA hydratase/carnithine racemase
MTPPELQESLLSIEGRVAVLTMNRPEVRNELTGTRLAAEIALVAEWINRDERISILMVTGEGSAFSAGGNLKHMLEHEHGALDGDVYALQATYRHGIQRMALAMLALEVPSIAAVNGPAIGPGFDLACMCDLRIGSTRAKLAASFLNLGLVSVDGGGWLLQRLVGWQRAAELTFSGRTVAADEALQLGLLLELVEPDDLLGRAREIAAGFAAKPPQALRLKKRLLRYAQRMEFRDYLDVCAVAQAMCRNTSDHTEAVTALLDKRPPVFEGR